MVSIDTKHAHAHAHHTTGQCIAGKKTFLFFPSAVDCWTHIVCFDDTNGEDDDAEDDDDEYGEFETEEIHLRTSTDGNTRLQRVIASYK